MPTGRKKLTPAQARHLSDRLMKSIVAQGEVLNLNNNVESFEFDRRGATAFARKETSRLVRLAKYLAVLGATGAAVYYFNPTAVAALTEATKSAYAKLPIGPVREKLASAWSKVQLKLLGTKATIHSVYTPGVGMQSMAGGNMEAGTLSAPLRPQNGGVISVPRTTRNVYNAVRRSPHTARAGEYAARAGKFAAGAGKIALSAGAAAGLYAGRAMVNVGEMHLKHALVGKIMDQLKTNYTADTLEIRNAKRYAMKGTSPKNQQRRFNDYTEVGRYIDSQYNFNNADDRNRVIRKALKNVH